MKGLGASVSVQGIPGEGRGGMMVGSLDDNCGVDLIQGTVEAITRFRE